MFWKEMDADFGIELFKLVPMFGCLFGALLGPFYLTRLIMGEPMDTNPLVRGTTVMLTCMSLLFMALNAASRVSREREQQTLEALLTTPLDSFEILAAKWLGSVSSVRIFGVFFVLIWGLGILSGGLHVFALPLVLAAYVVYAACLASLGLWFSLVSRTTLRATLFTLLAAIVVIAGPGLLVKAFSYDPYTPQPPWGMLLVEHALSPPLTLWTLTFHSGDLLNNADPAPFQKIAAALAGLHVYILLTVVLWLAMLSRLRGQPTV